MRCGRRQWRASGLVRTMARFTPSWPTACCAPRSASACELNMPVMVLVATLVLLAFPGWRGSYLVNHPQPTVTTRLRAARTTSRRDVNGYYSGAEVQCPRGLDTLPCAVPATPSRATATIWAKTDRTVGIPPRPPLPRTGRPCRARQRRSAGWRWRSATTLRLRSRTRCDGGRSCVLADHCVSSWGVSKTRYYVAAATGEIGLVPGG